VSRWSAIAAAAPRTIGYIPTAAAAIPMMAIENGCQTWRHTSAAAAATMMMRRTCIQSNECSPTSSPGCAAVFDWSAMRVLLLLSADRSDWKLRVINYHTDDNFWIGSEFD